MLKIIAFDRRTWCPNFYSIPEIKQSCEWKKLRMFRFNLYVRRAGRSKNNWKSAQRINYGEQYDIEKRMSRWRSISSRWEKSPEKRALDLLFMSRRPVPRAVALPVFPRPNCIRLLRVRNGRVILRDNTRVLRHAWHVNGRCPANILAAPSRIRWECTLRRTCMSFTNTEVLLVNSLVSTAERRLISKI